MASWREQRASLIAWIIGGSAAMYFEAAAIAAELRDFPGGAKALAASVTPTIEAIRILRWPADRLDTLGGYLAYHNVTLVSYFIAIYLAIRGAKVIRHLEESGTADFYLATGLSRSRLVWIRSLGTFLSLVLVGLCLGLATGFSMAASGEPTWSGSVVTLVAAVLTMFPFFAVAAVMSHLTSTSRVAAGITVIGLTILYVAGNLAGRYSWLEWIQYLSPFYYASWSRPLIPGFEANYWSWLGTTVVALSLLWLSVALLARRDIGSALWLGAFSARTVNGGRGFVPKTLYGDSLWRYRYGLIGWIVTTAAFVGVFIALMNGIVDIWSQFDFLTQFEQAGFGSSPAQQFQALVYDIIPPFVAGYIVMQSAHWAADSREGRLQLIFSTPVSAARLCVVRLVSTMTGVLGICIASIGVIMAGSWLQSHPMNAGPALRFLSMVLLFALAFSLVSLVVIQIIRGRNITTALSVYVGAAWLMVFMAPYLQWPTWIVRLSIFEALGHPFVAWPGASHLAVLLGVSVAGLALALGLGSKMAKAG